MEEALWFALGSLAGFALRGRGRSVLMQAATAAIRAGGTVSGAASQAANRCSALAARRWEGLGAFVAEARSKARGSGEGLPEAERPETPSGEAEYLAPA